MRPAADGGDSELETLTVWSARFRTTAGILVAMGILCFALFAVIFFHPELRNSWIFLVPAVAFGGIGARLWARRRRTLRIVRDGDGTRLVIDGEAELSFPLEQSGTQYTVRLRGVPMHHVLLALRDRAGRSVALFELRSAIQGPHASWYDDVEPGGAGPLYEAVGGNSLSALRDRIAELESDAG
jgi:hypothetical protein